MRIREYNFVDPGASGSGREIVAGDADEGLEEEVGISPNSNAWGYDHCRCSLVAWYHERRGH